MKAFLKRFTVLGLLLALFSTVLVSAANANAQFPVLKHHHVTVLYDRDLSSEWKTAIQQATRNVSTAGWDNDLSLTAYSFAHKDRHLAIMSHCSGTRPCFIIDGHNYGVTRARYYTESITHENPFLRRATINTSRWKALAGSLSHAAWKRKTANAVILRLIGEPLRTGLSRSPLNGGVFGQSYPASVDVNWINSHYPDRSTSGGGGGGGSW